MKRAEIREDMTYATNGAGRQEYAERNKRRRAMLVKRRKERRLRICILTALIFLISFTCMNGLKTKATTVPGLTDSNQITYDSVHIDRGDTLWGIACAHTDGSKSQIRYCIKEIRRINHMTRFEQIKAGASIVVPNLN